MPTNSETLVTVFGGSGFVGRHVVRALARRDFRIRAAMRRPDLAGHLQPLGRVGQIQPIQANLRYGESIEAAIRGAQVVVNLVGILAESGKQTFADVQAAGAGAIASAAAAVGARVVHVSAIGADENSKSVYARSKALGEKAVLQAAPGATILRPSIIFGPEDDFFNRFALLAQLSPALPLIGGGKTRFQPVFVGDVAAVVADAAEGKSAPGTTYELGGPEIVTFREVLEFILRTIERDRFLVPLPFFVAKLYAYFLRYAPGAFRLTPDQVDLLKRDNVVSEEARAARRTFEAFGVAPSTMEAIVPSYLWRFRKTGQFKSRAA